MTNYEIVEEVYNAVQRRGDLVGVLKRKFGKGVKIRFIEHDKCVNGVHCKKCFYYGYCCRDINAIYGSLKSTPSQRKVLESLGVEQYVDLFNALGTDAFDKVKDLPEKDIDEIKNIALAIEFGCGEFWPSTRDIKEFYKNAKGKRQDAIKVFLYDVVKMNKHRYLKKAQKKKSK